MSRGVEQEGSAPTSQLDRPKLPRLQVIVGSSLHDADSKGSIANDHIHTAPATMPVSATATWINLAGLASFVLTTLAISHSAYEVGVKVLLCLAAPALTIIILEAVAIKTRIPFNPINPVGYISRPSGLPREKRICLKMLGLALSVAGLALIYWLFPIYRFNQTRYFLDVIQIIWPPLLIASPIYIAFVDSRQANPDDGYLHLGLLATGEWSQLDRAVLWQHCLQWLVKAFFMPLMIMLFAEGFVGLQRNPIEATIALFFLDPNIDNWLKVYGRLYDYLFLVDVGIASVGYLLTLKLFDSHLRSAEPTLLGWVVCLACYTPFWSVFGPSYFNYGADTPWAYWFEGWPMLKLLWSILILMLIGTYALSTVQFGIRFSNLTHRGIITNGPYSWLKHPAYISKNLSYWLMSLPFLSTAGIGEGLRNSALLLGVNMIYYLRAKTEEVHLRNDPIYRDYEAFMRNHGLLGMMLRRLTAVLASLRPG
jgi:protein-S-isoprenylcysteine O-methyltransferase Ste14